MRNIRPRKLHTGVVTSVAFGEAGDRLLAASGGADRTIRFYDPRTGNPVGKPLCGHTGPITSIALGNVNGRSVAVSGSKDGTIGVWDVGRRERTFFIPRGWIIPADEFTRSHVKEALRDVTSVAIGTAANQPIVVSGSRILNFGAFSQFIGFWDFRTGKRLGGRIEGHGSIVTSVALGTVDDQSIVVSGSNDKTIRLWDVRTGKSVGKPLCGHAGWVTSVALGIFDDLPVVVSGSNDTTIRLWDARTGDLIGDPLKGHTAEVTSITLGTVGGRPFVISGSLDETVRAWDARTFTERFAINVGTAVMSVNFRPGVGILVGLLSGILLAEIASPIGQESQPKSSRSNVVALSESRTPMAKQANELHLEVKK